MKREEFYHRLSDVPPVPDSLYSRIEKKIRRNRTVTSLMLALAASLIITVGITSYTIYQTNEQISSSSRVSSEEIIDELQTLNEFVNGNSLDDEMEMYTLVNANYF